MSITFWVPDAPEQLVETPGNEDDYYTSTLPELNVASGNASIVFNLLGIAWANDCGSIAPDDMDPFIKRLLTHKNQEKMRKSLERETFTEGNMTVCGVDAERIKHYVDTMLKMLVQAKQAKLNITWG